VPIAPGGPVSLNPQPLPPAGRFMFLGGARGLG
jgi:hypothetical protein